jgi:hypothetical protein
MVVFLQPARPADGEGIVTREGRSSRVQLVLSVRLQAEADIPTPGSLAVEGARAWRSRSIRAGKKNRPEEGSALWPDRMSFPAREILILLPPAGY